MNEVTISEALKEVRRQANVDFFYSDNELDVDKVISVNLRDVELVKVVSKIVGHNFKVEKETGNVIIITPLPETITQDRITVKGIVKDANGVPLGGATVLVKGTRQGSVTDFDGNYRVLTPNNAILVFSYVGYVTKEVEVKGQKEINVVLQEDLGKLEEVVITGIVNREKSSFTGAVTTVEGEDLKAIGNLNVLESLKTLDPSFVIVENNDLGSDPNRLPEIEVRGKTSITGAGLNDEFGGDPNQPLFILDGFETNLQTIVDLDMNRVASITILKDASSTALYGAKAANGVVVVETLKPEVGKLQVSYNSDFRIEMPDLTDYNLMNAEQKLQFEVLSGRWTSTIGGDLAQFKLDEQYNSVLAEVKRGVDTYWLNEPLQIGTTLGNSLRISGGEEAIRYGIGLNRRRVNGVMIGSGRETWGADFSLNYRKNRINVTNHLYINGFNSENSNYGSFSDYANANPYYRKTDADGFITKYLDTDTNVQGFRDTFVENPLYQSTLNSSNGSENIAILNNFNAIFTINNHFRLQSSFQLSRNITNREQFVSPEDIRYDGVAFNEKGSYTKTTVNSKGYTLNTMLTYSNVIKDLHRINANARAQIGETENNRFTTIAIGFPIGTAGNPAFATTYDLDAAPGTANNLYRRVNFLGSTNYSYDNRYLFDFTYRLDGSTVFGSNEKYTPFWSVGAGWNLHNELNLNPDLVSLFKIRGNIGYTGNQNFGSSASTTIYGYNNINNVFGQGIEVNTLANPDLEWQKTFSTSVGTDLAFFGRRLTTTLNFYRKTTDPLVVVVDLPSSTGVSGYPINTGKLTTTGYETIVRYSPIYNLDKGLVWTIGLTQNLVTGVYSDFNSTLNSLNDAAQASNALVRYKDGYSPEDIWAVESLGIDPSNGREVFLTKEGSKTYDYNADDIKVMGNARPKAEGVISNNLRIKNFRFGINMRYRIGGDVFNRALYNKVENISAIGITQNQDVRALFDRWQNPGHIARFKSISITSSTPISSRFIQRENVLIGESINMGYDFKDQQWISSLGLSRLRVRAYMNDIFRLSTVRVERGISYPFSRAVSFSLNASF